MPMGRRLHHVRSSTHRARLQMVALQRSKLPPFLKVNISDFELFFPIANGQLFFTSGDTASCLHNAPHEDEALGRQLPGTLLTLDAQCRRDRGTSACFKDERVCAQLFCFDAASGYCVAYRPAAEGSSCGDGQVRKQNKYFFIFSQLYCNFFNQLALSGRQMCARERKHHPGLFAAHTIVHQPQLVQFTVPVSIKIFKTNSKPVRGQNLSVKYFFCVCEITRGRISNKKFFNKLATKFKKCSAKAAANVCQGMCGGKRQ